MKKRLLAGICSLAMISSSAPLTVFAAGATQGGASTGTGTLEGVAETNVFTVQVPTVAPAGTFDYILDPDELIAQTNGARYPNQTFEPNATLFFKNSFSTYSYSSKSDSVEMINKCSLPLDVKVKISVASDYTGQVSLNSDATFAGDTAMSMYMAILTDDGETPIPGNAEPAVVDGVLNGVSSDAIDVTWDQSADSGTGAYVYTVNTSDPSLTSSYSFKLKGASNSNGSWTAGANAPSIDVVWKLTEQVGDVAPSATTTALSVTAASITDTDMLFDFGNGTLAASSIVSVKYGDVDMLAGGQAILDPSAEGKVTVSAAFLTQLNNGGRPSGTFLVKFNDAAGTEIAVPYTIS